MAAGCEQQEVGKRDTVGQARRQGMALQVIDRQIGQFGRSGHGFGRHRPDDDAADKSGARGRGDGVEICHGDPGIVQSAADQGVQMGEVVPRRHLRNDAAIGAVGLDLAVDAARQDRAVTGDHGRSGLVARRLDAQDDRSAAGLGRKN